MGGFLCVRRGFFWVFWWVGGLLRVRRGCCFRLVWFESLFGYLDVYFYRFLNLIRLFILSNETWLIFTALSDMK